MGLLLLNELIPWNSRHFPFLRATCPDLSESGPRSAPQRHCVWRSASWLFLNSGYAIRDNQSAQGWVHISEDIVNSLSLSVPPSNTKSTPEQSRASLKPDLAFVSGVVGSFVPLDSWKTSEKQKVQHAVSCFCFACFFGQELWAVFSSCAASSWSSPLTFCLNWTAFLKVYPKQCKSLCPHLDKGATC